MDMFRRINKPNCRVRKPYHAFCSVKAGRVMDLCQDGDKSSKGFLIIWDGYSSDNQSFTISPCGPDFYIKCRKNKQYLTVQSDEDGAKVFTAPKNNQ